jgi:hypothetical protein
MLSARGLLPPPSFLLAFEGHSKGFAEDEEPWAKAK